MFKIFLIPDKEKNYQGYMVYVLSIVWSISIALIVSITYLMFPDLFIRNLILFLTAIFIGIFNLSVNYYVSSRVASWTLPFSCWLIVTMSCYSAGGMLSPHILTQMVVIIMAGYLIGSRGGMFFGILTALADLVFVYMELNGTLPIPSVMHTPFSRWIGILIPLSTIFVLQYYATNQLRTNLSTLMREIVEREKVEKQKNDILFNLKERVKELKTLYSVSRILQDENTSTPVLIKQIADELPSGWQHEEITAARLWIGMHEYSTPNFKPSKYNQKCEFISAKGTKLGIEVVYLESHLELADDPFLKEEWDLVNMLLKMLLADWERRERRNELNDYKYAIDVASLVSISELNGTFSYVNDNFCKTSKYKPEELIGMNNNLLWSGVHSPDYFTALENAMQNGKTYRGEFCNKAKDGTLYWVDTSVVPFIDDNGKVYQYLSINQDITVRKNGEEKIKENERILRKITSQVPANTYMFEIDESGNSNVLFMNHGADLYNANDESINIGSNSDLIMEIIHDDDKIKYKDEMKKAYQTQSLLNFQYRIVVNKQVKWQWLQAIPEKSQNGQIVWYGATSDITHLINYMQSIEQMIFDISHVLRRPVATMLGLTKLIIDNEFKEDDLKVFSLKLYEVSKEMDEVTKELNKRYNKMLEQNSLTIDISNSVDKSSNVFS